MKPRVREIFQISFSLPYFPLWAAPLLLFSPAWAAGKAIFWGTPALQFIPWWSFATEMIEAGHLPLWNPYSGMGSPLLANYQSGLFYPPNWVFLILHVAGGAPLAAWAAAVMAVLHLAMAGIGMSRLARSLGISIFGQAAAGLAYGLSLYLTARAGFLSMVFCAAWLPWIMAYAAPLASGEPRQMSWYDGENMKLVLTTALLLLAGHAQLAWYTLLLAAIWAGFWGWHQGVHGTLQRLGALGRAWLRLGFGVGAAAALAAVQLIPTAEYLIQSQRAAAVDFEYAMTYSFWPWRFLNLLAPDLYGNPGQGNYWGYGNYWEDAIYVGVLPLLLALSTIFPQRREAGSRKSIALLWIVGMTAALLALGKNTPLYPWLYHHVPTFAMFQAPSRWMIWFVAALALLAGMGAESWQRPVNRGLYWTRLGTAGAFAVMLGTGLAWLVLGNVRTTFLSALALAGFWGLLAGFLSLAAPQKCAAAAPYLPQIGDKPDSALHLPRQTWQRLAILAILLDLSIAGWRLNPVEHISLFTTPSPAGEKALTMAGDGRLYLSLAAEKKLKFERFFLFSSFNPGESWENLREVILPNLNLLEGLASANNFDPLIPGRYARWMELLETADDKTRQRLLALMGVSLVEVLDQQSPAGVRFAPIQGAKRFRFVVCSLSAAGEQSWDLATGGEIDFDRYVILEDGELPAGSECEDEDQGAGWDVQSLSSESPNRLELIVKSDRQGWVVVSDTWYPGWLAYVDESPSPVVKANYLFRAVAVPAGKHRIVLLYRPFSFQVGAWISAIACTVCLVWFVLRSRKIHGGRVG